MLPFVRWNQQTEREAKPRSRSSVPIVAPAKSSLVVAQKWSKITMIGFVDVHRTNSLGWSGSPFKPISEILSDNVGSEHFAGNRAFAQNRGFYPTSCVRFAPVA